jgi:oligoribonuclease (3'-5' exoribonuclease)
VREHYEATGLLAAVRASRVDVRAAERAALELVAGWCAFPAVLCGSYLAYVRPLLDRQLAALSGYLSARSTVALSTVRTLARLWGIELPLAAESLPPLGRAIADLAPFRRSWRDPTRCPAVPPWRPR